MPEGLIGLCESAFDESNNPIQKQLNYLNEHCNDYSIDKEKIEEKYSELFGNLLADF